MVESMQCFIIICMVFLNCRHNFLLQRSRVQRCLLRPMAQDLDAHLMHQCITIQSVSSRVMMVILGLGLK